MSQRHRLHGGCEVLAAAAQRSENRGVQDIFIACVDGMKGFPGAIEAAFPKTQVQLCIVHLVQASLQYVSWKLRKAMAADLRRNYTAPTAEAAAHGLEQFADKWDKSHPAISHYAVLCVCAGNRKVIYTTNAVELNMTLRKVIKTRALFPNEEAAIKLLYLGLLNVAKKWNTVQNWREALNQFHIMWPGRMPSLDRC